MLWSALSAERCAQHALLGLTGHCFTWVYATDCRTLNEALSMRTFLAGYTLTVADMAIWGQLQGDCQNFGSFHRCSLTLLYHMHGPAWLPKLPF